MHTALADLPDTSHASIAILKALSIEGELSQHEIASRLHHSDAAVSRQISILTEKGYISSRSNPENRRSVIISLTQEGKVELQRIMNVIYDHFFEVLKPLSDEQISELTQNNKLMEELLLTHYERQEHES